MLPTFCNNSSYILPQCILIFLLQPHFAISPTPCIAAHRLQPSFLRTCFFKQLYDPIITTVKQKHRRASRPKSFSADNPAILTRTRRITLQAQNNHSKKSFYGFSPPNTCDILSLSLSLSINYAIFLTSTASIAQMQSFQFA